MATFDSYTAGVIKNAVLWVLKSISGEQKILEISKQQSYREKALYLCQAEYLSLMINVLSGRGSSGGPPRRNVPVEVSRSDCKVLQVAVVAWLVEYRDWETRDWTEGQDPVYDCDYEDMEIACRALVKAIDSSDENIDLTYFAAEYSD